LNKPGIYILTLLMGLAAIMYFVDSPEQILGTPETAETERDAVPFAIAHNATTQHYDTQGTLSYTFETKRLAHYKNEEGILPEIYTLIDNPKLVIYDKEHPWVVVAKKGKVNSATDEIVLWEDVKVTYTDDKAVKTRILTEQIEIDPINKFAKTDEPVRILSDNAELEAIGMTADLTGEKIKLMSKVHGYYTPK